MKRHCHYCRNEATDAMQFIADDKPTFYAIGWHMRGFKVTRVCADHKELILREWDKATPIQRKDFSDIAHQGALYPLG